MLEAATVTVLRGRGAWQLAPVGWKVKRSIERAALPSCCMVASSSQSVKSSQSVRLRQIGRSESLVCKCANHFCTNHLAHRFELTDCVLFVTGASRQYRAGAVGYPRSSACCAECRRLVGDPARLGRQVDTPHSSGGAGAVLGLFAERAHVCEQRCPLRLKRHNNPHEAMLTPQQHSRSFVCELSLVLNIVGNVVISR